MAPPPTRVIGKNNLSLPYCTLSAPIFHKPSRLRQLVINSNLLRFHIPVLVLVHGAFTCPGFSLRRVLYYSSSVGHWRTREMRLHHAGPPGGHGEREPVGRRRGRVASRSRRRGRGRRRLRGAVCRGVEEAVDEHDVHDVVPDVALALHLLPLLRRVGQQSAHVEHDLVALEHRVHRLLASSPVCAGENERTAGARGCRYAEDSRASTRTRVR